MEPPTILVIEDDAGIREMLEEALTEEGYTVEAASDGLAALQRLEALSPSLIMLDVVMPYVDGVTFIRNFHDLQTDVPVLIMSASVNAREVAEECGADGYLDKPFDIYEMLSLVSSLIHER